MSAEQHLVDQGEHLELALRARLATLEAAAERREQQLRAARRRLERQQLALEKVQRLTLERVVPWAALLEALREGLRT